MNRRGFIGGLAAATLAAPGKVGAQTGAETGIFAPDHPLQPAWAAWKAACLSPEGRVIDGFQQSASHSEGQGYGLTLAAMFGDAAAAAAIAAWTEANLALRDDALLAWRWLPDQDPHVPDHNNASDGDLFYAWGLVLLAQTGGGEAHLRRAKAIADDLIATCLVANPAGPGHLLLPGAAGFRSGGTVVVNPSYPMPRALREVARATGRAELSELAQDTVALWTRLAEGGLVPDWTAISAAGFAPPPEGFSPRAGYEAIRVPLFALWSGMADNAAVAAWTGAARAAGSGETVTVFDTTTRQPLERSAHPGYAAVAALADCAGSGGVGSLMPAFTAVQPYYPATLHLMALVAQAQFYPRCVPI